MAISAVTWLRGSGALLGVYRTRVRGNANGDVVARQRRPLGVYRTRGRGNVC